MQIQLLDGRYVLQLDRSREELSVVRSLPSRKFIATDGVWHAPFILENYAHLVSFGYDPDEFGIEPPTISGYYIGTYRSLFKICVPFNQNHLCKRIPEYSRWSEKQGAWTCKNTRRNITYLAEAFSDIRWTDEALVWRDNASGQEEQSEVQRIKKAELLDADDVVINDYKWGTTPFLHQAKAFLLSRDVENFAILMEQGTGKTKVVIDTASWQHINHNIDAVLIVCPNSVKSVWPEEIELHTPPYIPTNVMVYSATMKKAQREAMEVFLTVNSPHLDYFIMNVDAFSRGTGSELAKRFLTSRRVLWAIDESSRIKSQKANRTKAIIKLRLHAKMRRILSGTPVPNGPLDYFTQFKFLDPEILGFGSYYAFRNYFCLMGGYEGREILEYVNIDELVALVDPHSFRVLREDCLDLPEKIYQKLIVDMAKEQNRLYNEMADDMIAELSSEQAVTVTVVLTQMLRLQQITGGFIGGVHKIESLDDVSVEDAFTKTESFCYPIEGTNPKIVALLELADDVIGKIIIWARFRPELALIKDSLQLKYGEDTVVEFHGGCSTEERTQSRQRFQDPDDPARFFLGNPSAGGLGITLTEARTVVYYSNSFSLEDRLQSEDRVHRIGLKHTVTYIDLLAGGTIDEKVVNALRSKKTIANLVTGDKWKEWI